MVTKDFLINPKTGAWELVWTPPNLVPKGAILDLAKIRGRVMAREKPAYLCFTESDFLPAGTKPGIVAGIPLGKRAMTLDAGKLKGVHELKAGDHVDLLASVAVDMPGAGHSNAGRSGPNFVATPDALLLPKRGFVRPLVEDGVVVTPVKIRNVPTTASSLTQGATTRTIPVQEIVLAVAPDEVRLLAEAIDLKYEITCVARSGRPEPVAPSPPDTRNPTPATGTASPAVASTSQPPAQAAKTVREPAKAAAGAADHTAQPAGSVAAPKAAPKADITPGLDPMADIRYLEVMIGKDRQFMLFNGPGKSPVVAAQDDGSAKPDAAAASNATPANPPSEGENPKSE